MWHLIEGEAGCEYAVAHGCVAVVVDALRASATAAMLLDAGATELVLVGQVETALALKREQSDVLLFGERGGLPPEGFDYGNSPRTVSAARGRRVIFTTTTGTQRVLAAWGARAVYLASTVNASALVQVVRRHDADVVLIPAGLAGDPGFDAQEDWVAAAVIAMKAGAQVGIGAERSDYWRGRIADEGATALFASAPHAAKLRRVGLDADIVYCAQVDITKAVPCAVERAAHGVIVRHATGL